MVGRIEAALLVTLVLVASTCANGYTVNVAAHEVFCFYEDVPPQDIGRKLSFRFAVHFGGAFDIDFEIKDPKGSVIHSGVKEKESDSFFNVDMAGEYTFCFSNKMSTITDKIVNFELELMGGPPKSKESGNEDAAVDQAVSHLRASLDKVHRAQSYYRTRESRNFQTASDTESRMFWVTLIECAVVVIVAVAQVFAVRMFFKGSKAH